MQTVKMRQLYLLRAMYLLIAVGLSLTVWPAILFPAVRGTNQDTVIYCILAAFCLLSMLGLRYPLQMLPILLFELIWKTMWVIAFALPAWLNGGLNEYATGVAGACIAGIVITPIAIPWKYVYQHYVKAASEPWKTAAINNNPTILKDI